MLYTPVQLRLLVALAATLLVGLGAKEWRAGFPALADRMERFDREELPEEPLIDAAPRAGAPRAAAPADGSRGRVRSRPGDEAPPGQPAVQEPSGPLDLNRAGAAELARLPGVGPSLARRIVEERERGGGFDSPESLLRVHGLGPRKLAALRGLVVAARPGASDPPIPAEQVGAGEGETRDEIGSDGADASADIEPDLD